MSFMFGGNKSPEAPKPQPLPEPPKVEEASDKAKKKRTTPTQTVYSSPMGLSGQAQVMQKSLLGQ
jgi:hypothetical protein